MKLAKLKQKTKPNTENITKLKDFQDQVIGPGRVPDYPGTRPESLLPEATRTRKLGPRATRARPDTRNCYPRVPDLMKFSLT